jgi:hypothetical protein
MSAHVRVVNWQAWTWSEVEKAMWSQVNSSLKITLYGTSGMIGSRILDEALRRGHTVTAVVRDTAKIAARPNLTIVVGDATDAASVAATAVGSDVAISAYSPGHGDQDDLSKNAHALLDGLVRAHVSRVISVGGAGSLDRHLPRLGRHTGRVDVRLTGRRDRAGPTHRHVPHRW